MIAPILCVAGPTAAGKSASILALAEHWPIEIISVDSATIYRGMDIGTAKPSAEERARIPHHLLDIRDPAESYSAAEFRTDALTLIAAIEARGRRPVLCGGTMLYYKALREGLDDLPPANPAIRAELDQQAAIVGWPAMHARLTEVDPKTAARLSPNDSQRVQRALEVYLISGQPMSSLLGRHQAANDSRQYITLSLEPSDRLALHARIAQRYQQMLNEGLLDEVRTLKQRQDLHIGLPSIRCVGYRQLWEHLDGTCSLAQATEQAIAATRQLAKRQLTWLRSQPGRIAIDCLRKDLTEQVIVAAENVWGTHP